MQNILTPVLTNIALLGLSEGRGSSFMSVILCRGFLKALDFLPNLNGSKQTGLPELQSASVDASGSCTA